MSGKFFATLSVAAVLSLIGGSAFATDSTVEAEFPEIVVTATVEGAEAKKLPASVQVVTRQEMDSAGIHSVQDALSYYVPGSGDSKPGAYGNVGLRGFRSGASVSSVLGDRVVLLIDGLRASSGNPGIIPFAIVDRIEIVRGPASVMYGGSAMGGVINVITRKGHGDMRGEVGASYGRFDDISGHAGLHGALSGKWGMALGVESSKRGDYKSGGGKSYENTHSADADVGATLTYTNEGTSLHMVGVHRSVYDTGSPGGAGWFTPGDRTGLHYSRLSGQLTRETEAGHKFSAAVYGDRNIYKIFDGTYGSGESRYTTYTAGTRLTAGFSLGDWGRFSAGVDYANMREKMGGNSIGQPDSRNDLLGLFAEYRWEGEKLSLISGLRYDSYNGKLRSNSGVSQEHTSKDYDHLSWELGAVYWLTDWLGLKASTGTSFVAPTAVNLAGNYAGSWGHYVGNPNLDAETCLTAQGGLEMQYGGFRAEVMYFQSWYKDRIASVDLGGYTYTWRNISSQRLNGFDLELAWRGDVAGVTVAPYLNSEIFTKMENGDGSYVGVLPHHSTVAGLGLGWKKLWLDVNARFTGTQKQNDFASGQAVKMDAYTVVNARLTLHATDSLDLYLGVNNLTDRYYAVTLGYPLPGRAVYGGFIYKF
ncbi:MAG: TonB-dependent receptor [Mailhella sp.]|nr:TonB-dependent receptor [Mailhella sp.]